MTVGDVVQFIDSMTNSIQLDQMLLIVQQSRSEEQRQVEGLRWFYRRDASLNRRGCDDNLLAGLAMMNMVEGVNIIFAILHVATIDAVTILIPVVGTIAIIMC